MIRMRLGAALRLSEPEIRHTTGAQPSPMINCHVRTRDRSVDRPTVTHFRLISVANPERQLSRTLAPFRESPWAAWDGCLGDENVSGKFEPSAQFPHLF